jgi:hypothetical protein
MDGRARNGAEEASPIVDGPNRQIVSIPMNVAFELNVTGQWLRSPLNLSGSL